MSKIVCLTAGHSNTDPGAVNGSDREADLAQDMRNIVASILRNDYGLTVRTDGEGKGNMPLREAVKLIRGSDVAIEFHTNAAASKAATGIEALSTIKNKRWCQVLSKAVAKATGWKLRGEDGFTEIKVVEKAVMPTPPTALMVAPVRPNPPKDGKTATLLEHAAEFGGYVAELENQNQAWRDWVNSQAAVDGSKGAR